LRIGLRYQVRRETNITSKQDLRVTGCDAHEDLGSQAQYGVSLRCIIVRRSFLGGSELSSWALAVSTLC
jgi:hypothetical protein